MNDQQYMQNNNMLHVQENASQSADSDHVMKHAYNRGTQMSEASSVIHKSKFNIGDRASQ